MFGPTPTFSWPHDIAALLSLWLLLVIVCIVVGAVVAVMLQRWLRGP